MHAAARTCRSFTFLLVVVVSLSVASPISAQAPGAARWERLEAPGPFIVALCQDLDGNVWIGTEDQGVFRYDPRTKAFTQFTTKDGLGDDNGYAICCDRKGRIWVGLQNHGVAVFNGKEWRTYDVLDGPIGERVFDIACSPKDGDVWIATSAGLTRYSESKDTWTHYTRLNGLPEDQANAIAFDAQGNVIVGTQCHGLAFGSAANDFATWRVVSGPGPDALPVTSTGRGLPSCLINDVLVARDGAIHVATCAGLATSRDGGRTWNYLRGREYAEKVKKRWGGPPKNWEEPTERALSGLLPEDYVTCLAEDASGALWLGFRLRGCLAIAPRSGGWLHLTKDNSGLSDDYVYSLLASSSGQLFVGGYLGGLNALLLRRANPTRRENPSFAPLPSPAASLDEAGFKELLGVLGKHEAAKPATPNSSLIIPLEDDWKTKGNWIDRYGRFAGVLCAMGGGGNDYICGYHASWFDWRGWIGPNHPQPNDVIRRWVHWQRTNDVRSLQNPVQGGRKQSEWDDHKEAYPLTLDGPHLYGTIKLPPGQYTVACYFFNKDGHSGMNRVRDYLVDLRPTPMQEPMLRQLGRIGTHAKPLFDSQRSLATSRVREFWGGVYKRFYLHVPPPGGTYTIRVHSNHSFNTILSSIFVDPIGDLCGSLGPLNAPPKPRSPRFSRTASGSTEGLLALRTLDACLCLGDANPTWYVLGRRRSIEPLLRTLLRPDGAGCLAKRIDEGPRVYADARVPANVSRDGLEWKRHASPYTQVRWDCSKALRLLHMFDRRDSIYFDMTNYELYSWNEITAGHRPSHLPDDFDAFVKECQRKHQW